MIKIYKELIVWQQAMKLVEVVYRLMEGFPKVERFRLCDQLSCAVISIPSNIAEVHVLTTSIRRMLITLISKLRA